jgi:hypothetical protein
MNHLLCMLTEPPKVDIPSKNSSDTPIARVEELLTLASYLASVRLIYRRLYWMSDL